MNIFATPSGIKKPVQTEPQYTSKEDRLQQTALTTARAQAGDIVDHEAHPAVGVGLQELLDGEVPGRPILRRGHGRQGHRVELLPLVQGLWMNFLNSLLPSLEQTRYCGHHSSKDR